VQGRFIQRMLQAQIEIPSLRVYNDGPGDCIKHST